MLGRSNFIGIKAKWGAILGAFDIRYKSRNSVKGQVLEDFVAEFSPESMVVYGVSNNRGSSVGVMLESPKGIRMEHSLQLAFQASTYKVEYEALLVEFRAITKARVIKVGVCPNSLLVVSQFEGDFKARDERMSKHLKVARLL